MFAIGQDQLDKNRDIGQSIDCPHCGNVHDIEYGEQVMADGTKQPSRLLSFYKCGNTQYLAAINGKAI